MDKYYRYSNYLKEKYGVKTYKLPINLPMTCPNRDGNLGENGCAFCGEDGAAFEKSNHSDSVTEQLLEVKEYIGDKYNAEKFIAYFQNFTNTYLPLNQLINYVKEALKVDDIVEIALSTRPDCINKTYLNKLDQTVGNTNLSLELGLQTVNYHTLKDINRKHTLAEFIDAVLSTKTNNIDVGVHLILNLPGDECLDIKECAKILSALKVDTVKLHALYIRENTEFGKRYQNNDLELISLNEYVKRVITFLVYLSPDIAVQRLLGRAPRDKTLFVNWGYGWGEIHQKIINQMDKRNTYQGKKFDYLQGKALRKFEIKNKS